MIVTNNRINTLLQNNLSKGKKNTYKLNIKRIFKGGKNISYPNGIVGNYNKLFQNSTEASKILDKENLPSYFVRDVVKHYLKEDIYFDCDSLDSRQILSIIEKLEKNNGPQSKWLTELLYIYAYKAVLNENKFDLEKKLTTKFGLIGSGESKASRLKVNPVPFFAISAGTKDKISYINDQGARTELKGISYIGGKFDIDVGGVSLNMGADVNFLHSSKYDDAKEMLNDKAPELIYKKLKKNNLHTNQAKNVADIRKHSNYIIQNKRGINSKLKQFGFRLGEGFNDVVIKSKPALVRTSQIKSEAKANAGLIGGNVDIGLKNVHIYIDEKDTLLNKAKSLINTPQSEWIKNKFNENRRDKLVDVVRKYNHLKTKYVDLFDISGENKSKNISKTKISYNSAINALCEMSSLLEEIRDRNGSTSRTFTGIFNSQSKKLFHDFAILSSGIVLEVTQNETEKNKAEINRLADEVINKIISLNGNKLEGISFSELRELDINFKSFSVGGQILGGLGGIQANVTYINKPNHDYYKRGEYITMDVKVLGSIDGSYISNYIANVLDMDCSEFEVIGESLSELGLEAGKILKLVFYKPTHSSKFLPQSTATGDYNVIKAGINIPSFGGISYNSEKTKINNFTYRKELISTLLLTYHAKIKIGEWEKFKKENQTYLEELFKHIATNQDIKNEILSLCDIFKAYNSGPVFSYENFINSCERYNFGELSYNQLLDILDEFLVTSINHYKSEKMNYFNRTIIGHV